MKSKIAFVLTALSLFAGGPALADGFYFGDETKGVTLSSNESDLNIRIRLQPRFDYGDIIKSSDGKTYETEGDLYLRRVRLEMGGSLLTKTLKYNLTLNADKWDQAGHSNEVNLHYAYLAYEPYEQLNLIVGKEKLPYSRVSLSSSSKQLLIERPASTEAAKKLFGASDPYYQPKVALYGRLLEGVVAYEAALADGWQNGETVQTGRTVLKASPLYAARVELSPPGWVEKKKSDAHLGKERHLALGAHVANQSAIEYKEAAYDEDRTLWGADLSGHYKGLTAQLEYIRWTVDSDDPAISDVEPWGWYAQAGYFIDSINLEPAVRYEVYDQDSNSNEKEERNTTLGLNWYGKGHSLKVGANWVHTEYDANAKGKLADDDSKDVYQIQAQLYF